ncbi:MAG TPA: hypothetical protein VE991_00140, partial [Acidimicrobiales bacterium]|nr:hypothetical protein [Acidimicrobiales bacterium]
VYEIYKVGEEPRWEPGLDLLGPLGLQVAVIPHYDNAEGGTHDTRFCYLGEERLARLEQELPDGAFVLGVDEHTALTIDFDSGAVVVSGRGVVTVRVQGRSAVLAAGEEPALQDLHAIARRLASGAAVDSSAVPPGRAETPGGEDVARVAGATGGTGPDAGSPLIEAVLRLEAAFRAAKAASDARAMAEATLELEAELWAWRADTLQSDEADRGRAALRAMVAELGALAQTGARDPAEVYGPFVEVLLEQRDTARRERRFDEADRLRDRLADLGVEVRDGPEGSSWARL